MIMVMIMATCFPVNPARRLGRYSLSAMPGSPSHDKLRKAGEWVESVDRPQYRAAASNNHAAVLVDEVNGE